jgi:hypothetical protein
VIGGAARNHNGDDEDDGDYEELFNFSSTEVLAVEAQRGAPATHHRQ